MLRRQGWSSWWIWMGPCRRGRTESEPDVGESLKTACKTNTVCSVSQLHREYLLLDLWLTWKGTNPWNFYWLAQMFIFILPCNVFVVEDECFIIFHWPKFFTNAFCCFLLCMCACVLSHVWLCDPTDHRLPDSSVHGILQTRMLEWVAISYSKEPSQPRDWTHVSCISYIDTWILYHCIPPGKLLFIKFYFFDKKFFFYIWNVSTTQNTRETVLFELSVVFVPFCAIQEALVITHSFQFYLSSEY